MNAYRRFASGEIKQIKVDVDKNGNPILPADTTVDPRPDPAPGYYVTVVDNTWVQILTPVPPAPSLEQLKQEAIAKLSKWKEWVLEQPVNYQGQSFDADDVARNRLTQAVTLLSIGAPHPAAWVTYDNSVYDVEDAQDLTNLALVVANIFQERFTQATALRAAIDAATTESELEAVVIPAIPNQDHI